MTKFVYCPICRHPLGDYPSVSGKCWKCNILIQFKIIPLYENKTLEDYI